MCVNDWYNISVCNMYCDNNVLHLLPSIKCG